MAPPSTSSSSCWRGSSREHLRHAGEVGACKCGRRCLKRYPAHRWSVQREARFRRRLEHDVLEHDVGAAISPHELEDQAHEIGRELRERARRAHMCAEEHGHGAHGPDDGDNQDVIRGNQGHQEVGARGPALGGNHQDVIRGDQGNQDRRARTSSGRLRREAVEHPRRATARVAPPVASKRHVTRPRAFGTRRSGLRRAAQS